MSELGCKVTGLPIQGAVDWMARERQYADGINREGSADLGSRGENGRQQEQVFPGCRKDSERSLPQGLLWGILDGILLNVNLFPHTEYFSISGVLH